jgi:hypothetical protein
MNSCPPGAVEEFPPEATTHPIQGRRTLGPGPWSRIPRVFRHPTSIFRFEGGSF